MFELDRGHLLAPVLLAAGAAVLGVGMMHQADLIEVLLADGARPRDSPASAVVGLIVVLCALPVPVYAPEEPGLVVDRAGIDDRPSLLGMGRVPWGNIAWHEVDTWRSRS